jgi:AraC-like DNA-binding protein
MFAAAGQTAGQYILQSRLNGSAKDLSNPGLAHLTITDIAVSWGFNSSSTFSRAFHKYFKVSPRAYRAARAQGLSGSNIEHDALAPGAGATSDELCVG